MLRIIRKILILTILTIISIFTLAGCDNTEEANEIIHTYVNALNEGDYDKFYELLSNKSKEEISKDEFIKRYTNIYSSIGVNNIKVDVGEINDISNIPLSISMNTIAGQLKYDDAKINIVKEDDEYKIVWDDSLILPPMIKDDKVRYKTEKASRGKILDRNDKLLAYDSEISVVNIHPSAFEENKEENINQVSSILDINIEDIKDKLDKNQNPEHLVPIVKISNHEAEKIENVSTIKGIKVTNQSSRVYMQGEAFGSLIGYVGDITKEELDENKGKGYNSYSKIGKKGLEQVYEQKLKATDGVHIYIERGNEEITVAKTKPKNGEDIKLAIDSNLQANIYSQMSGDKGASVAIHPKTGEVLAMVSSPSYDSNTLVTYKTNTIKEKWEQNDVFENRANNVYSPGSTMKLITAAIGLEEGIIKSDETVNIDGLTWQKDSSWGDYSVSRVKQSENPVNLYDAIKYSDNIYFAQKAIEIGEERYLNGVKKFGIGEELEFEYPMENSQISNNKKLNNEILLGDTGYGQGEVLMSPLDISMAYSALGNEGKIMMPRLVISDNSDAKVYKEAIDNKYIPELINCFKAVVNDSDGTASEGKIPGIDILGKTGTAEIKSSKEDISGTENGWFIAMNINDPQIAISMIIEDVKEKGSSKYVVPKVKNVINSYLGS